MLMLILMIHHNIPIQYVIDMYRGVISYNFYITRRTDVDVDVDMYRGVISYHIITM